MPETTIDIAGYRTGEQVYAGTRTVVFRAQREANGESIAIKLLSDRFPRFSELVQFRNQYILTKNLDLPGVVKTYSLERYQNRYALILEDFGGISLSRYLKTWLEQSDRNAKEKGLPLGEFLPIALQIVDALEGLYHNFIIHKDLKPANILINPVTKKVKLIDFSIASLLPRETQVLQNPNVLEGTLAYLSPEQTGRMNRGIDYRTDFYSLGVTFYELLAGQLPFQSDEPMELVHAHLAQQPIPLHELDGSIPPTLSNLVSKLMAKNAEQRYQSAGGIKHDLEVCWQQWQETGAIAAFKLAQRDLCDRFIIPEKLYGREPEVNALLEAFERVSYGSTEMMLVAGFSGIGKTAAVNEVHKPIVRQRGYFIKGKFDQFQRNLPFSAFVQAFRNLMGQLFGESSTQVQRWKAKLLQALGENAQVILDVIPELEGIIGKQPPIPELSGAAAQNRFNLLFQKFIEVFTQKEHPLVIFLDDLQWADSASLDLIKLLMNSSRDRPYLFLIGAYRDNEVNPAHPLMLTLGEIQKNQAIVNKITLEPLARSDVNALIADTLLCSSELAAPLTDLVDRKTKGNPFFITQFLKSLYEDGLIEFNQIERYWQCDLARVRSLALTDDVVEFMALQLQKLPESTQDLLKLAACIGHQFDLNTLAIVRGNSLEETARDLWNALQEGSILPTSELYKFYQIQDGEGVGFLDSDALADRGCTYQFLHDRVQQAAYSLIPDREKQSTHLTIGQLLLNNTSPIQREEKIFDIVNQLNYGIDLIAEQEERDRLAELNLIAGRKAKTATAYVAANTYLTLGRQLLRDNPWQTQYEIVLELHALAAEVAYLMGNFQEMESLAQIVLENADRLLDKVKVYEIQLAACTAQVKPKKAVELGVSILKLLGIEFPEPPTPDDIQQALADTASFFADKNIINFVNAPEMRDPQKQAAMRILSGIVSPAYITAPLLLPLVILQMVQLSAHYGNHPLSAFAYGLYGLVLSGVVGDIETGDKFGQLALQIVDRFNANYLKTKVFYTVGVHILHGKHHVKATLPLLKEGYAKGLETGELEFGYCGKEIAQYSYLIGSNLAELEPEVETYCQGIAQYKQEVALNYTQIVHQVLLNLLGQAENPWMLVGDAYNEIKMLPFHQQADDRKGLHYFHFHKLLICYLFGEVQQALLNAVEAERYLDAVTGMLNVPTFYFYDALARLAVCVGEEGSDREHLDKVVRDVEILEKWSHHAPMNFAHKLELVKAERFRVLGKTLDAIEAYDRAIELAKQQEYLNEEAIANEKAAHFYLAWGKEKLAQPYLVEAYYAYARWGAKAKIEDLETRYSPLLAPILQGNKIRVNASDSIHASLGTASFPTTTETITGGTTTSEVIDLPTIIKASQALSSEMQLDRLLSNLMQIAIENAGAQTGTLILKEEENWKIAVYCSDRQECRLDSLDFERSQQIPVQPINYVRRTQETLVFDNASTEGDFASDPYIIDRLPKSVLCMPICDRGQIMGILYLENNQAIGAFTRDRVAVLNILCAQAAISIENAQLYRKARDYSQQLEGSLHDLQAMHLQLVQSEKMSALGNLVAGVAHEINNPVGFLAGNLQPARGYVDDLFNLLDRYQEKFPEPGAEIAAEIEAIDLDYLREDLPQLIDSMQEGVDRIRNISTSLRTFSRADRDRPVPFSIHDGLDSTILILKHRLKANANRPEIEVVKDYGNLPQVKCFPGQLNQVFMNILANAIDALEESNQGCSFAQIKDNPNRIAIYTEVDCDRNLAVIRIKDNGMGMSDAVKQKVFDHLFTTKPVGQGTGLGLSIARQIVTEKHGGTLQVNSSVGQGCEFVISLPINPA